MIAYEARVVLMDRFERKGFDNFMLELENYRAINAQQQATAPAAPAPATEEVVDAEYVEQKGTDIGAQAEGAAVVGEILPQMAEGQVPTQDEMLAAARGYIRKHQYAKTQELLTKRGLTKFTEEMAPDVARSLYAELTAK